jgi:hypothetical protein
MSNISRDPGHRSRTTLDAKCEAWVVLHRVWLTRAAWAFLALSCVVAYFIVGIGRDADADYILFVRGLNEGHSIFRNILPMPVDLHTNHYTYGHPSEVVNSYGYSFQFVAYVVAWVTSHLVNIPFDITSATSYAVRNALTAALGVAGCYGVFITLRSITNRVWVASLGFAMLAISPLFIGHSWMNQKDAPLATGVTLLVALATVCGSWTLASTRGAHHDDSWVTPKFLGILAGSSIFLTVGVRPGIVPLMAPMGAMIVWALFSKKNPMPARLSKAVWWGLAVGMVLLILTNAAALPNPVTWLFDAIRVSRSFSGWQGYILVYGKFITQDAIPWWYLPTFLLGQTPTAFLVAFFWALWVLARGLRSKAGQMQAVRMVPVLAQVFGAPIALLVTGAVVYNAARQVLFVYPGIVTVAALGAWYVARKWKPAKLGWGAIAVAVIAIGPIVVDNATLFPYQYIYMNEAMRVTDIGTKFEADYWALASRDMQEWVNDNVKGGVLSLYPKYPAAETARPYASKKFEIIGSDDPRNKGTGTNSADVYIWQHYWPKGPEAQFGYVDNHTECPVTHRVSRWEFPRKVDLGYVRVCTK